MAGSILSWSESDTSNVAFAAAAPVPSPEAPPLLLLVQAAPTKPRTRKTAIATKRVCRMGEAPSVSLSSLNISRVCGRSMGASVCLSARQRGDPGPVWDVQTGSRLPRMIARYFVELPVARDRAERVLNDAPETWLPGYATTANHRGDQLLAEVGFGDDVRIARTVAIDVGAPIRLPTKWVLPVRWTAAGASGLFPALDADLEIAPLGH